MIRSHYLILRALFRRHPLGMSVSAVHRAVVPTLVPLRRTGYPVSCVASALPTLAALGYVYSSSQTGTAIWFLTPPGLAKARGANPS